MSNTSPQATIGAWTLINLIGTGATSSVFQGQHKDSRELAAVKVFNMSSSTEALLCKAEASVLEGLDHPNIVKLIGFEENVVFTNRGKKSESVSALLMEYVQGGEFFQVVQDLGSMSETIVRTFFSQILSAVDYLHTQGIAHMDLKLENLLLGADNTIKIADFGCAIKVVGDQKYKGLAGTLKFQPPEALEGKAYIPFSSDIFALGIMLFILVVGYMPFGQAEASDPFYCLIYLQDMTGFWELHQEYCKKTKKSWRAPSKEFKDLFFYLVHPDPVKRYSAKDIAKHKWISLSIVDTESLSVWMKTKKRILTKAKTAPPKESNL